MTKIVGILNLTTNSFSDGGKYIDPKAAIIKLDELILQGADVVDIGACSTSYGAPLVSHQDEWAILKPILNLRASNMISVDTYNWQTAEKALAMNVGYINDVSFGKDKEMLSVIANSNAKYILMYSITLPASREKRAKSINEIINAFKYKIDECLSYGIRPEQIIIDPGIGFSTDSKLSIEVLKNIDLFKEFNLPIMIGHSRKSFLEILINSSPKERDIETTIASIYLYNHDVDYIRVHNVDMHKRAFNVYSHLK